MIYYLSLRLTSSYAIIAVSEKENTATMSIALTPDSNGYTEILDNENDTITSHVAFRILVLMNIITFVNFFGMSIEQDIMVIYLKDFLIDSDTVKHTGSQFL